MNGEPEVADMHEPPPYPETSLEWVQVCRCSCHSCCMPMHEGCEDCEENHDEF